MSIPPLACPMHLLLTPAQPMQQRQIPSGRQNYRPPPSRAPTAGSKLLATLQKPTLEQTLLLPG